MVVGLYPVFLTDVQASDLWSEHLRTESAGQRRALYSEVHYT